MIFLHVPWWVWSTGQFPSAQALVFRSKFGSGSHSGSDSVWIRLQKQGGPEHFQEGSVCTIYIWYYRAFSVSPKYVLPDLFPDPASATGCPLVWE